MSELKHFRQYTRTLRKAGLMKLLIIVSAGTLLVIVCSPHAQRASTLIGLIVNDLIAKYFVIGYVFAGFKNISTLKSMYRIATFGSLLLLCFGIMIMITKVSVVDQITGGDGTEFANMDRSRVVSLFTYAFDYGFCCCLLTVFAVYGKLRQLISERNFYCIFFSSLTGVFICGCRSIVVVEGIIILIFIFMNYKITKALLISSACCILLAAVIVSVPAVREKAETVNTAFDADNREMGESSIFMRIVQYAAVMYQIEGHETFGRGYRYFIEDLHYNENGNGFRDMPPDAQPLMGLEGVGMNLLLERGYVGLSIYFIFYAGLIILMCKYRKRAKLESACAAATIIGFVCYGNMTGELSSSILALLLTGLYLKLAYEKRMATEVENNSIESSKSYAKIACNHNTGI